MVGRDRGDRGRADVAGRDADAVVLLAGHSEGGPAPFQRGIVGDIRSEPVHVRGHGAEARTVRAGEEPGDRVGSGRAAAQGGAAAVLLDVQRRACRVGLNVVLLVPASLPTPWMTGAPAAALASPARPRPPTTRPATPPSAPMSRERRLRAGSAGTEGYMSATEMTPFPRIGRAKAPTDNDPMLRPVYLLPVSAIDEVSRWVRGSAAV